MLVLEAGGSECLPRGARELGWRGRASWGCGIGWQFAGEAPTSLGGACKGVFNVMESGQDRICHITFYQTRLISKCSFDFLCSDFISSEASTWGLKQSVVPSTCLPYASDVG